MVFYLCITLWRFLFFKRLLLLYVLFMADAAAFASTAVTV